MALGGRRQRAQDSRRVSILEELQQRVAKECGLAARRASWLSVSPLRRCRCPLCEGAKCIVSRIGRRKIRSKHVVCVEYTVILLIYAVTEN